MINSKIHINTAAPENPEANLLIIYTGGTVGMVYDEKGALVPFDFQQILDKIPSLSRYNLLLTVISFVELIDSSNATPETWQEIGDIINENYNNYDGFVVLHGTDTMAYSASAVSFMLQGLNKPVVFTGAQLPIGAVRTDARENLVTALEIASAKRTDGAPIVPEVCIYFNYRLLRGNRARKVQSVHFDAFESNNYPLLAEAGVEILFNEAFIRPYQANSQLNYHRNFSKQVLILKLFPGISQEVVENMLNVPGLKGVVLETFGSGNAPTFPWFIRALEKIIANGVVVLNISQCHGGKVMQGRYGTSKLLEDIGVLSGADMTTEAAMTKTMLLLGEDYSVNRLKSEFSVPLCGEMAGD
ncbi:asparaginase [Nafulsella turpanensis]|uniref:asparaginase n=1 Tax=Nafulsella turpanensis TaxID=1265690 RepID=UPI000346DF95|nr:asparaginase [Nafulsella turpanensis]